MTYSFTNTSLLYHSYRLPSSSIESLTPTQSQRTVSRVPNIEDELKAGAEISTLADIKNSKQVLSVIIDSYISISFNLYLIPIPNHMAFRQELSSLWQQ